VKALVLEKSTFTMSASATSPGAGSR